MWLIILLILYILLMIALIVWAVYSYNKVKVTSINSNNGESKIVTITAKSIKKYNETLSIYLADDYYEYSNNTTGYWGYKIYSCVLRKDTK